MAAAKRKAAPSGDDTGSGRLKKHTNIVANGREEINGNLEDIPSVYEIRKAGAGICFGHIKNLGYSTETLKDMARHGLHLYRDGKRVKL